MALLVSAKGNDVLSWRASSEFALKCRQMILGRTEFCLSDKAVEMLTGTSQALEDLAAANDAFCSRCDSLIDSVSECYELATLRELTTIFFTELYNHNKIYQSALIFYQFSMLFLKVLAGSISQYSRSMLGPSSVPLPELALIVLGPAGREEYSPFCPLQLLIVHGHSDDSENEMIHRFACILHEGFEACGLMVDNVITPRNNQWRGTLSEWGERLGKILGRGKSNEVVEFLRLSDQTQLDGAADIGSRFRQLSLSTLSDSPLAINNLVSRVVALSHGIGIMGGLKLEKNGPCRGQFALIEYALQPLSASLSALGLLKHLEATATPQRVRELLWRRELDVDTAERLLQAWHTLHEIRLVQEREKIPDWQNEVTLHLNIEQMSARDQEALRESLEAVGIIQRYLGHNFSGLGS